MDHKLEFSKSGDGELITFEDAVTLTNLLINYINTDQGKDVLNQIGKKFNLTLKKDFTIWRGTISKNCPDCSGCHNGSCILGCMKTPGYNLCYWDEALEKIVGTGLVVHELAHIWFDQAYDNILDRGSEEFFQESEEYAQYVENNFTSSLAFCEKCEDFVIDLNKLSMTFDGIMTHPVTISIITGMSFAIGGFVISLLIGALKKRNTETTKIEA